METFMKHAILNPLKKSLLAPYKGRRPSTGRDPKGAVAIPWDCFESLAMTPRQDFFRVFILLIFLLFVPALSQARPDYDEKMDQGHIFKEITIPEGSDRANVLVNAVINSPPEVVWAALIDINRWPKWLPMNRVAYFVSPEAEKLITPEAAKDHAKVLEINKQNPPAKETTKFSGHWEHTAYEEYDLPWPLKNEWVVRRYQYDEGADIRKASWKRVDSTRDEDDGSWEVRPWKDGHTHLTYLYRVKAKEGVPQVIFKTAVSMTVNSMIKALRHESARREAETSRAAN